MASYKPGDTYARYFTTSDPATGAATDADSLPTVAAYHAGSGTGAFAPAVAKVATGLYSVTGTIPGTFAAGDVVNLVLAAVVGGVTGKMPLDSFVLDGRRVSDLAFPANFASMQVTAGGLVSLNLAQTGLAPRALDAVADAALTVGDALVCAVAGAAGKQSLAGTSYAVKSPSTGTTIRTFTLDSATTPTSRS